MKNEKKVTGVNSKAAALKTGNEKTGKKKVQIAGAGTDAPAASNTRRASAGRGLMNEGTNVSYDDQNRNG